MRPIRAVMVSHNLELEGAPNSQYELTSGLIKTGNLNPIVVAPHDGPLKTLYEENGIDVSVIQPVLDPVQGFKNLARNINRFAVTLDRLKPEVLYANTLQTFWAIEAAQRCRIPSIWNIRESEPAESYFDFLPEKYRDLAYHCLEYPSKIVFVANSTKENWRKFNADDRMTVINNGLDLVRFRERMSRVQRDAARRSIGLGDEVVFLIVGTVSERKGQIDAIKAFIALPESAKASVKILIVGDRPRDPYSAKLHAALEEVDQKHRGSVIIVPETGQVELYYAASDVFLCTSRLESYPRTILEAMACGMPIISTPVYGIREQVRESVNGIFYDPGNIPQLTEAIGKLAASKGLRAQMSLKSSEVFASLTSYPQMIESYKELFIAAAASAKTKSRRDLTREVIRNVRDRWLFW